MSNLVLYPLKKSISCLGLILAPISFQSLVVRPLWSQSFYTTMAWGFIHLHQGEFPRFSLAPNILSMALIASTIAQKVSSISTRKNLIVSVINSVVLSKVTSNWNATYYLYIIPSSARSFKSAIRGWVVKANKGVPRSILDELFWQGKPSRGKVIHVNIWSGIAH